MEIKSKEKRKKAALTVAAAAVALGALVIGYEVTSSHTASIAAQAREAGRQECAHSQQNPSVLGSVVLSGKQATQIIFDLTRGSNEYRSAQEKRLGRLFESRLSNTIKIVKVYGAGEVYNGDPKTLTQVNNFNAGVLTMAESLADALTTAEGLRSFNIGSGIDYHSGLQSGDEVVDVYGARGCAT